MPRNRFSAAAALLTAVLASTAACTPVDSAAPEPTEPDVDPTFAALQARGEEFMGVDQYTSTHRFDALPDGGRIELQRDVDDPAGIARIRSHFREIAAAFAAGDFGIPALVHLREVPGTAVMAAKKDRIEYIYRELPRGAELRLVTDDPEAIDAIHAFMAFQREDHRAGGVGHHGEGAGTMHDHHHSMGPDGQSHASGNAHSHDHSGQ